MKYNIDYTENDFLQFQLFTASQSKRIKNKNQRSTFTIMACFLLLAMLLGSSGTNVFQFAFIALIPITYFFYPKYLKNHHYNHYRSFVKDVFQKKSNQSNIVEFKHEEMFFQNEFGESRLNYHAIEKIAEIPEYIFITLKTGNNIILPKKEISDYEDLFSFFREKSQQLEFDYSIYKNWSW